MARVAIPRQVPVMSIGAAEYVLVPSAVVRAAIAARQCKFKPRGRSYDDWKDAMDRYFNCLFPKPKAAGSR